MTPPHTVTGWSPDDSESVNSLVSPSTGAPQPTGQVDLVQARTIVPSHDISRNQPSPTHSEVGDHDEDDGEDERHGEQPRKGDPDWAPRPRNPFIIFRVEYSRTHNREAEKARGVEVPAHHEKSLSKRAADDWKALSPAEKKPWADKAELEKAEHALKYPDYQFRPEKKKQVRSSSSQTRAPSRATSSRRKSPASSLRGQARAQSSDGADGRRKVGPSRSTTFQQSRPPKVRSPSVSHLPVAMSIPLHMREGIPNPKLKRRSRSLTEFTFTGELPFLEELSHGLTSLNTEATPSSLSNMFHDPHFDQRSTGSPYVSPLAAISSSLANWNGDSPDSPTSPFSAPYHPSFSTASASSSYHSLSLQQTSHAAFKWNGESPQSPTSSSAPYSRSFPITSPSSSYQSPPISQIAPPPPQEQTLYPPEARGVLNPDVMWSTSEIPVTPDYFPLLNMAQSQSQSTSAVEADRVFALEEYDIGLAQNGPFRPFEDDLGDGWANGPSGMVWVDGEIFHDVPDGSNPPSLPHDTH